MLKKNGKARDSQRSKVYKSDDALKPFGKMHETVQDCERFVKHVMKLKRVQKSFRQYPGWQWKSPRIDDGRGCRRAHANHNHITLPKWSRSTGIILHELAHTIHMRTPGSENDAGHGWQYCAVYLRLVQCAMGKEAHDALKAAFKANGVRFTAPRKRKPLTPEQRAALVERMARAREARKAA